jgi:hypothetical protein
VPSFPDMRWITNCQYRERFFESVSMSFRIWLDSLADSGGPLPKAANTCDRAEVSCAVVSYPRAWATQLCVDERLERSDCELGVIQ